MAEFNKPKFTATLESAMEPLIISANLCHRKRHKFVFNISPSQRRVLNDKRTTNFHLQVLMRIGLLCEKGTIWDKVPQGFRLLLNNNYIRLSRSPINLTPYIRALMGRKLVADVSWLPGNRDSFVFTVVLLKLKNSHNFLNYISKRIKNTVPTGKEVKGGPDNEDASDLEVTSQNVSLLCPLGIKRIQVPVLGEGCNHLQCFDAGTFFSLNLLNPKWVCPVCLKPTYPQDLVIVGSWKQMLKNADSDLVSIRSDGSWKPVSLNDSTGYLPSQFIV